ncbi:MAG: M1 family aminopeptidase [Bacteroidota bacterium]
MFKEFFRYDLVYRLRQPMIYIFFAVVFLLVFIDGLSENVTIGGSNGQYNINSGIIVASKVTFMSLLAVFMTVALTNAAALRDFDTKFGQILFTVPLRKNAYIYGRFLSSVVLALIPVIAILLAILTASFFVDSDRLSEFSVVTYTTAFFFFGLPNTLIAAAILFPVALKTRKHALSFVAAILLFIGYQISSEFIQSFDNQWLAAFLDPFGVTLIIQESKYWTIEEMNTLPLPITSDLIFNRVLWISISGLILFLTAHSFSFAPKLKRHKKNENENAIARKTPHLLFSTYKALPSVSKTYGFDVNLQQLWIQLRLELGVLFRSPAFLVLLLFGTVSTLGNISNVDSLFGTGNQPVSFLMVDGIRSSLYLVIAIVIGFYSGQLVWAERKAKMNELVDVSSQASWVPLLSKFLVLTIAVLALMSVNIFFAMLIQLIKGYTSLEPLVYFIEIIALDLPYFMLVIALALLIHVLVNRQYLGFFLFLVLIIFQLFVWPSFEIDSNLLSFGGRPEHTYSDMSRWLPYADGLFGYTVYWSLIGIFLLIVGTLFWVQGQGGNFKNRLATAKLRFHGRASMFTLLTFLFWGGMASLLFYKSDVLNENLSRAAQIQLSVDYEQTYKKYEGIPQPRVVAVDYQVDLYPEKRGMQAQVKLWLQNKHQQALSELYFSLPTLFSVEIDVPASTITLSDKTLGFQVYKLDQPLAAGDSIEVVVNVSYEAKGIENELQLPNLTQNGIFLNNTVFMPVIGYDGSKELPDDEEREKYGLGKHQGLPELKTDCSNGCQNNYISSDADWVKVRSVISTSSSQTAIAPGELMRTWQEGDRNYYEYEIKKPVINFFAFLSGQYEVKREKWNGIDIEVYHHPTHDYNVEKMITSMKASIDYNSTKFSPYPHRFARVIEFPRFAKFAQAFPGTMPYSESIGFLADLKDSEDIDVVTYVVSHEMAHQWWAHQLIGANMEGTVMLAESFAQYSALMVMEKMYGKEKMHQFLKYEMDKYLDSRSKLEDEPPLVKVGYENSIYYNKGSVVMYALREYLGEDSVNMALRRFMDKYAYTEPPYPTSLDFMEEIYAVTPDSLRYLVDDFFHKVILYDNAVEEATYTRLENGKYEVKLTLKTRKLASTGKGTEEEQALNDYIGVGIYGKKEAGKSLGKQLYREFHQFQQTNNQLSFITDEEPVKVAIDPRYLLPDRFPEDNMKSIDKIE